ncbi:MFS transporter [Actinomadura barringtoniae]|uniref:MFS transporter n=1 Tax=Actinomadura barringtoniae TaxID=1427535 RepID=A0A939T7B3_9ACTN|nr:MFS transporter [Actinomadura barringtoniae]MBO2455901.1 MFS transporter [Actinomadura barringtoniae]
MGRLGRSVRTGGRGVRRAVRHTGATARGAGRLTRRATHAHGADRSGLGSLIEAGAINSTGDALVAVALAGTLFFGLDVNQARGQVALYLLVTMAPFALVAPLIGPALDKMRHARRYAIAGTFVARGLLCWGMAGAVPHGDIVTFMPAAFGVLVLSKAFGVLRAAVTPRVLPEQITLVTANARASFAGLIAAAIAAPLGAGFGALVGADWLLRVATVVFLLGVVFAMRLPKHVDEPEPDLASVPVDLTKPVAATSSETAAAFATASGAAAESVGADPESVDGEPRRGRWRTMHRVGPIVAEAMEANAVLRAFSGFLILYLAFLLREERFERVSHNVALGLLAACAGIGGLAGTALGAWMKARAPMLIILVTLALVTAVAAVSAVFFGLWAALAVTLAAGLGQSLGKLSLDAVVQREIGDEVRSSTFAVTETLHQLVWVIGGLAGLGMSIVADGRPALAVVAAALALALAALLARQAGGHRLGLRRRRSAPPGLQEDVRTS